MTAFFFYAVTDCSCKYVLLFEYFARKTWKEKPPKASQAGISFKCASFSTLGVYYSGQHLFLFLVLLKKNTFLFQNCDLDSLHVSLGNSHVLAKGGQFQDRQEKMPFLPCFPIQFEIGLIRKKKLEILLVTHCISIANSFSFCFGPFCCCAALSHPSPAAGPVQTPGEVPP